MWGCTPYDEENVVMRTPEELDEYYDCREQLGGSTDEG